MSERKRWVDAWYPGVVLGVACLVLGGTGSASAGHSVYLALGDSITPSGVGADDTPADMSDGDRGYVGRYADYLATRSGGVRPQVINLAVSGETIVELLRRRGRVSNGPDASARNTNYSGSPTFSQDALMLSTIKAQMAAGNTISTVTPDVGCQ